MARSRACESSHVYVVADHTSQAVDDLRAEWSSERRERWVIDTDAPAHRRTRAPFAVPTSRDVPTLLSATLAFVPSATPFEQSHRTPLSASQPSPSNSASITSSRLRYREPEGWVGRLTNRGVLSRIGATRRVLQIGWPLLVALPSPQRGRGCRCSVEGGPVL